MMLIKNGAKTGDFFLFQSSNKNEQIHDYLKKHHGARRCLKRQYNIGLISSNKERKHQ